MLLFLSLRKSNRILRRKKLNLKKKKCNRNIVPVKPKMYMCTFGRSVQLWCRRTLHNFNKYTLFFFFFTLWFSPSVKLSHNIM